jgi:hypothetical protein
MEPQYPMAKLPIRVVLSAELLVEVLVDGRSLVSS